ncbi:polysaccharide lyase family 1 protein [Dothidotthia symphoricarpi CBS 119687]|uniref:pectin lyase n=1 Tax=Dothidotthia symphoricarpi CBS 119687 TaxID=1392245 RepID=A0A6A6ATC6_9PLEO|nr:polysaccharide lyase family 1 protein [Dothidotthia symphoricarpi CBS 119687]KAF2133801.1 polysaccharide lyase family 1 protein [Dothidotthia symphoricarpi CBS 119687]
MRFLILMATLLPMGLAQVVGKPSGFATGTTGGGSAKPAVPKDNAELVKWLTDDIPRVIMLNKTYDFNAAEGKKTETGCRPASNTCRSKGQDALNGPNWCSASYPKVRVTYNVAPTKPIDIKGNKSIVGVGNKGVIRGKGFRLVNVKNIVIQNVHFTDLNPQYIWGGDALQLAGTDMVWIDHCKFSLVGRQMIVTGYASAGRVTLSNNDFDGRTSWSASCNGQHYWTLLLLGDGDKITFANNYVHSVSGRAPKIGGKVTFHAVNNYFADSKGHNFDTEPGSNVLLEGNFFQDCKTPMVAADATHAKGNIFNVPDSAAASLCTAALGRVCMLNQLSGSGKFPSQKNASVMKVFNGVRNAPVATSARIVPNNVSKRAGVGKISN